MKDNHWIRLVSCVYNSASTWVHYFAMELNLLKYVVYTDVRAGARTIIYNVIGWSLEISIEATRGASNVQDNESTSQN
eukprot:SAG11_NODE_18423_length_491_cov_2.204082_1_plen_78_part_00